MRLARLPELRCAVFPLDPSFHRRESGERSSRAVRPPSGCYPVLPCPRPQAEAPLLEFSPLQHRQMRQLLPRGSTLEYSPRPRFFTVIAGILPAHPFRAYFIPEALLGFSLQGFPLERRPRNSSLRGFPHVVPTVATASFARGSRTSVQRLGSTSGSCSPLESVRNAVTG